MLKLKKSKVGYEKRCKKECGNREPWLKHHCKVYGCNYSSDKKKNPKVCHKYPGIQNLSFFVFPFKITKPKI